MVEGELSPSTTKMYARPSLSIAFSFLMDSITKRLPLRCDETEKQQPSIISPRSQQLRRLAWMLQKQPFHQKLDNIFTLKEEQKDSI